MTMTYSGIPASDARGHLGDLCNRVAYGRERIVLTRYGRPLLAFVPLHNIATLKRYGEKFGCSISEDPTSIVDAKDEFAKLCQRVSGDKEIVIITRSGTPRLALVPLESQYALDELEKFIDADQAQETMKIKSPENAVGLKEFLILTRNKEPV